jgi:GNAT superfamily N-acetyltransferase
MEIRRQTFSHFAPSAYSPEEVQTLLDDVDPTEVERMIESRSLFVAVDNFRILGSGGWLQDSVRHMYVSPDVTRRGIGSALLRALERDYRERTGKDVIEAGVILYARPFYERNGYDFLRLDTDWDGSQFNRMQKRFDRA